MQALEPAAFRAWLEAQPRSRCIGVALSETGCPLARYLGDGVLVDRDRVDGLTQGDWAWLPLWAQRFIALVDDRPSFSPGQRRVYPGAALALLDEALEAQEAP